MSAPDDADCVAFLSAKGGMSYKNPGLFTGTRPDAAAVGLPNLGPVASVPQQQQQHQPQHMPLRQMAVQEQPQQGSWMMQQMQPHHQQLMWQKQAAAPSMHSTQQCSALSTRYIIQQQQPVRSNATVTSEGPSRVPQQVSLLVPIAGNVSMVSRMPAFSHLAPGQAQLLAGTLPAAAVQPAASITLQQLLHMQQLRMLQAASPAAGGSEHSAGTTAAPGGPAAAYQPVKNRRSIGKAHSSSRSSLDGVGSNNSLTKAGAASRRYR
jgi:hypothetical protein